MVDQRAMFGCSRPVGGADAAWGSQRAAEIDTLAAQEDVRCTLFADHPDDDSADVDAVLAWHERWGKSVKVVDYSTGGSEHLWNVEAPLNALQELPKRFFRSSAWAEYPSTLGGEPHPLWAVHPDDS